MKLKEEFVPTEDDCNENQLDSTNECNEKITTVYNGDVSNLSAFSSTNQDILSFVDDNYQDNNKDDDDIEPCDNKICHTLKQNLPPETHKNNNFDFCDNQQQQETYGLQLKSDVDNGDTSSPCNYKIQRSTTTTR